MKNTKREVARGAWNRRQNGRLWTLLVVILLLFSVMIHRVWDLQIIQGEQYARDYVLKITKTIRDKNTRGMIYDCNGEVLAYNALVYTVTMTDDGVYASERERNLTLNGRIYHLVKKLRENQEQLNNELKIKMEPDGSYVYTVSGTALTRFRADVFGKPDPEDMTPEQENISADEMMRFLAASDRFALYGEGKDAYTKEELREYGLPLRYTDEEFLAVVGLRYMLSLNSYKKYVPVTVARDVSEKTVAYILENQEMLAGVDIAEDLDRVYAGGEAFSHILGYTGKISTEELERYADADQNYTADSIVGKAGLEQYLEEHLQGVDGERQITVNNVGKTIGTDQIIRESVNGRDVYLSIDKNLQIAIYRILEQNLAGILASNLIPAKTFDKEQIADTSHIRIPIYDVYLALADNGAIRLDELRRPDATPLEQDIARALDTKWSQVKDALWAELLEYNTDYARLSEEMQGYLSYVADGIGLFEEASVDPEDDVYRKWKQKSGVSAREWLLYAMERGWIADGFLDAGQGYLTAEESYALLIEAIGKQLADDRKWETKLLKQLVLEDQITGQELCRLLYDQQFFPNQDEDYQKLMSGEMEAFSFIKKKIEHLEITPAQLALDPCSASAVVVQPGTGKVLALVSYPGYDNNRLANQMDLDYYNQLLEDRSLPLYNRATQQLTAPGSTLKPITIIAGLEEGVIVEDASVLCDGVFDKVEPSLKCWKHAGHGMVENAPTALQFSCNDYMCEIAYRMGTENGAEYADGVSLKRLQKYAKLFCLDQRSGVEIAESKPHMTDAYGIPSAIGQGTHNYATVQLARYVSALASGGDVFALSLIEKIDEGDAEGQEKEALPQSRIELPDAVWDTVHAGMLQFAQNNDILKDMQIRIAGKTGTAQEAKNRPDHALFVGYAPADDPEIAMAVRIANGYGSSNATAAGKSIFNYCFGLKNQMEIITGEASQAFNTSAD